MPEARISRSRQEPAPLPVHHGAATNAQASVDETEPLVCTGAGVFGDWVTLPVTVARCVAVIRAGRGAKAQVAVDVGRDLPWTAEALRSLATAGLIER